MTDSRDTPYAYCMDPDTVGTMTLDNAKAKQLWALEKIHRTYQPRVIAWCRDKGLNTADCEDASQTVFMKMIKGIHRFARTNRNQSLGAWLRRVAHRTTTDIHRERGRKKIEYWADVEMALAAHQDHETSISSSSSFAWSYRVNHAIEKVKRECESRTWQAFEEVVINGRQPNDVAADLGVERNVVYLAKSRTLQRLRELLATE